MCDTYHHIIKSSKSSKISKSDYNALTQYQKQQRFMDHDPKKIIMQWFQKIVLDLFKTHSMAYFEIIFVSKQASDLNKDKQVMGNYFFVELNNSPKYVQLLNSIGFLEWLNYKVSNVASNLTQWFEVFYP